ncbi:hypothetical protein QYF36_007843 [Acer negundo]|nr:hypothetical protein QYF36_007843 [Acer negundo]
MAKDHHFHVAMFPWSAFGHMMPFFQLSIALAKSGVQVSFISTSKNIQRLPKPPPDLSTLINFVEFQLPALENELLPEGAEATVDITFDQIQYLKIAYDLLQHPFKQFMADQSPDWIFVDVTNHWTAEIALEYQIGRLVTYYHRYPKPQNIMIDCSTRSLDYLTSGDVGSLGKPALEIDQSRQIFRNGTVFDEARSLEVFVDLRGQTSVSEEGEVIDSQSSFLRRGKEKLSLSQET